MVCSVLSVGECFIVVEVNIVHLRLARSIDQVAAFSKRTCLFRDVAYVIFPAIWKIVDYMMTGLRFT